MTRLFRARARASSAMAGRALALLAFAASAGVSDAAYYYGRYARAWCGAPRCCTTTTAHASSVRASVLQDEAEPSWRRSPPAPASGDAGDDEKTECSTILEIVVHPPGVLHPCVRARGPSPPARGHGLPGTHGHVLRPDQRGHRRAPPVGRLRRESQGARTRARRREPPPEPSQRRPRGPLARRESSFNLPGRNRPGRLRRRRNHHPFPPSTPKGIDEMLGNVSLKALIIAYHAIPNVTYTVAEPRRERRRRTSEAAHVDSARPRLGIRRDGRSREPRNRRRTASSGRKPRGRVPQGHRQRGEGGDAEHTRVRLRRARRGRRALAP